jgi:hypothetical protein
VRLADPLRKDVEELARAFNRFALATEVSVVKCFTQLNLASARGISANLGCAGVEGQMRLQPANVGSQRTGSELVLPGSS